MPDTLPSSHPQILAINGTAYVLDTEPSVTGGSLRLALYGPEGTRLASAPADDPVTAITAIHQALEADLQFRRQAAVGSAVTALLAAEDATTEQRRAAECEQLSWQLYTAEMVASAYEPGERWLTPEEICARTGLLAAEMPELPLRRPAHQTTPKISREAAQLRVTHLRLRISPNTTP